jgi:hypothetical protein
VLLLVCGRSPNELVKAWLARFSLGVTICAVILVTDGLLKYNAFVKPYSDKAAYGSIQIVSAQTPGNYSSSKVTYIMIVAFRGSNWLMKTTEFFIDWTTQRVPHYEINGSIA